MGVTTGVGVGLEIGVGVGRGSSSMQPANSVTATIATTTNPVLSFLFMLQPLLSLWH